MADERAFGWDDQIQHDSSGFVLLPEGEYPFVVESFSRAYHNGSAKLPPCNKAVLKIRVGDVFGQNTALEHNLFLHSKTEGLLCEFFCSIGLRRRGEALKMDWSRVPGASGRCKLGVRTWTGRDGEEKKSNEILRFLEPETEPQQTAMPQKSWAGSSF